jgi:hypothetical protein
MLSQSRVSPRSHCHNSGMRSQRIAALGESRTLALRDPKPRAASGSGSPRDRPCSPVGSAAAPPRDTPCASCAASGVCRPCVCRPQRASFNAPNLPNEEGTAGAEPEDAGGGGTATQRVDASPRRGAQHVPQRLQPPPPTHTPAPHPQTLQDCGPPRAPPRRVPPPRLAAARCRAARVLRPSRAWPSKRRAAALSPGATSPSRSGPRTSKLR